jgi:predicted TPR repeat methyltransferase
MNTRAKERWVNDISNYDIPHLRLRQIAKIINDIHPSSMVDLGCAKGTLRTLTPEIKYVGCDFAMPEGKADFEFHNCDFNNGKLPQAINNCELIACSGLLEYIEDMNHFIGQISERIKPGGFLVASYFNMNHIKRISDLIKGKTFQVHPDWRGFYSVKDIASIIAKNGFKIQKIVPTSHSLKASAPVGGTTNDAMVLPKYSFYSRFLAHQFIFVCTRK